MNGPQPQTSQVHPKHAKEKLGHGFEERVKFVNPGVSQGRKQGRWFSRRWAGVVCVQTCPRQVPHQGAICCSKRVVSP